MRARPLALAAGLWLCGCAQTLTVKVHRYDVDAAPASRESYAAARRSTRTAAQARDQVDAARLALAHYKGCLRSLNVLVQDLLPGLPDREAAKDAKRSALDASFQETETVLARMTQQLSALAPDEPAPSFEAQPARWSDLKERLDGAKVVTDPAELRTAIAQLEKLPNAALVERGKAVGVQLDALLGDPSVSCVPADAAAALTSAFAAGSARRARAATDPFTAALDRATVRVAAGLARARSGDLVPRPYGVWQDVTDPYLMYVVAHPEQWRLLVENTKVGGEGDVEYVLVFESPLDARLKTVTVDPSKVIQARLSIARKIAQTAVAAAGMATASFGVPLPTGMGGAGDDAGGAAAAGAGTIDYSRMTADEQVGRERNAAAQRTLERLRQDAARLPPIRDVESAKRAVDFLRRELKSADPASLSL